MIQLHFILSNPFNRSKWRNLWNKDYIVSCYKVFEIQLAYDPNILFEFFIDLRWKGFDHAGPRLNINFLGFDICLSINDIRHWDVKSGTWYNYGGEK